MAMGKAKITTDVNKMQLIAYKTLYIFFIFPVTFCAFFPLINPKDFNG